MLENRDGATTKSIEELAREAEFAAAAASLAEGKGAPEGPGSQQEQQTPQVSPEQQHAAMVVAVRGTCTFLAKLIEDKGHRTIVLPEAPQWWDGYTQSIELCLSAYLGTVANSPLIVFGMMTLTGLLLPNMEALLGSSKEEQQPLPLATAA